MDVDLKRMGEALAEAVLQWSTMPPSGNEDWGTDVEFAAEVVVPLAEAYLVASGKRNANAVNDAGRHGG